MSETPPPDPAPRGAGAARDAGLLEARLRAAREQRGLSLTDVQQETRIPADVLQRLEDGRLLGDATFNPVYLKALLKAYAGAVGLPADEILEGFDPGRDRLAAPPPHAVVAGTTPVPPEPPAPEPPPSARRPRAAPTTAVAGPAPQAPAEPAKPATPAAKPAPSAPPPPTVHAPVVPPAAPAVSAERPGSGISPAAAMGKHRVMRADAARTPRAFDRSWGLMIGGTISLAALFGLLLFFLFRDRRPEPEPQPRPVAADTAAVEDTTTVAETPIERPAGPTLAIPIRVAVTAGEGGLQNFRVTEEPNERLGHWIEEGETRTFESSAAVVIWGEDAEGLDGEAELTLQNLRWTPADGRVLRIDTATGQGLLDSLAGAGPGAPAQEAPGSTADG